MISPDSPFYIADWYVDPTACRIERGDVQHKVERRIEPRAMSVLICLARQQGQVVSREALEAEAWEGMVVGYDSLPGAIIKLRKAFDDSSKNSTVIETVPKKGYRLIAAVSDSPVSTVPDEVTLETEQTDTGPAPEIAHQESTQGRSGSSRQGSFVYNLLLAVVVLMVLGVIGLFNIDKPDEQVLEPQTVVIAVLPFKNLSDDPQQDYFSDGITVDLITDLSKVEGLSVIARNSVFIYKNSETDIRTVRDELGVDYVVEGSIRKLDKRVRISAQLIDASSSINVWAERFDGELSNIFSFQDAVTNKIIDALSINLTEQDKYRLADKYSDSIEAYDEFLRGWQNLWLSSREGMMEARVHFNRAIELDPRFARAYANLALTYIYDHLHGWSQDDEQALLRAHEYADKAISINPDLPNVYWVKGFADIFQRDYRKALKNAQRSIDLSPNFADGYGLLATIINYAGQPAEAEKMMLKAMKLNPKHPAIYNVIYGEILFNKQDFDAAIRQFTYALDVNPESEESRIWLASAYGNTGDVEEASWQLEQLRVYGREIYLDRLEGIIPFRKPEQRRVFIDGLEKAGLGTDADYVLE